MDQLRALRYFSKVAETGSFTRAAAEFSVPPSSLSRRVADQALRGHGIMLAPRWSLDAYLDSGELVELFFDPELRVSQNPELAIYLLYRKQRYLVPKVKAAVDFLVSRIQRP